MVQLILTYFVSHYGVNAVAGFGIGYRVEQLMLLPALGLSTAVLALVSNNYGQKNTIGNRNIKKYQSNMDLLSQLLVFLF